MKISFNWLRELVELPPEVDAEAAAAALTGQGLEVEGIERKGRELSDTSVQLLFAAFRSEYQVAVEFVISEYKGKQFRCLTGFTISKS